MKLETVSIRATPPPLTGFLTRLSNEPPCLAPPGRAASFCPHSAHVGAHSDLRFHKQPNLAGLAPSQPPPISPPKPSNPSIFLCFQETSGDRVPPRGGVLCHRLMADSNFRSSINAVSRRRCSGRTIVESPLAAHGNRSCISWRLLVIDFVSKAIHSLIH
jgi:hypothetical protein